VCCVKYCVLRPVPRVSRGVYNVLCDMCLVLFALSWVLFVCRALILCRVVCVERCVEFVVCWVLYVSCVVCRVVFVVCRVLFAKCRASCVVCRGS